MTWRLVAVFAHPDDDTHGVGGVLLAEGDRVRYTAVVATSGEAGEIVDPAMATREDLGQVREEEELRATRVLGIDDPDVRFLRYPDGGLDSVPRKELVERIADVLREVRPHVVVTFGPEGVTRHADHIAAGQAATEAFHVVEAEEAGADGAFQRLYYSVLPQSQLDRWLEAERERGVDVDPEAPFMPRGVPDHTVTVVVDCGEGFERKMAALREHATQSTGVDLVPEALRREAFGFEWFVQAWPPVTDPSGPTRASLFEDLEP